MKNVILMSLLVLAVACDSPLFNHDNADNKTVEMVVADENCPLSFPTSGLCAKIVWIVGPSGDGANSFQLSFWDSEDGTLEGPFVNPGHGVAVQLWMPSMGHGSSPVTVTQSADVGVYVATNVHFIMPGDWDIRVKLVDGATLVEQAVQSLDIP